MGWGKRVIVISHSIGRRMIDDFGVRPDRITLIHRGVDLNRYPFISDKYDKSKRDSFKIINIGRITPIKGHEEFIRAVHLLSKRLQNFEAWIVGSAEGKNESYFRDLKLMTERLGLNLHVKFLGSRRDVPELLQAADLLVLSSKIPEAFGRVLIEAGATGTAVCASRIGGILDIIEDQKNGLLFGPENYEEMALAMERLIRDRVLSRKFSRALRKKVETEFSLNQMVEKTCQVYQEVRQQKKILITKLGALGDLVLAVPSFRMIRKRFPSAHISLLVSSGLIPLVQRSPYLDELIPYDRPSPDGKMGKWAAFKSQWNRIFKLAKRLRERHFDFSVDFQNNWRTHLISFLARIPKRYGYRRGIGGFLLTHPVIFWNRNLNPVEHQFQVLKRVGIVHFEDQMELWPEAESEASVAQRFGEHQINHSKPIVGFVMGASPNWPTKSWPVERFAELAKRLIQRECQIVLIGTQEDRKLSESFEQTKLNGVLNLTGETNLTQLVSLIKRLDVLVTGDTAPLHIASACGTKIVAVFGPTEPKSHVPPGKDHTVLVKRIPCQPCYSGVCRNREKLLCLREISVREVLEAVEGELQALQKQPLL
jgi:lipopolysaccharide heptosyltransferase II